MLTPPPFPADAYHRRVLSPLPSSHALRVFFIQLLFFSILRYPSMRCCVTLRYVAVSSLVVFDYSASAVATTITITARVFVGYQCYVTMLICVSFNTVACCALYVLLMLDRFPSDRTPQWRLTTRTSWQVFGLDSSDVQQTSLERFADDDGPARLTTCNSCTIFIITGTVSINWQYWPFYNN